MGPSSLDSARKEFDKKFKDKSGHSWDQRSEPAKKGKYTFLEKNYEDDEDEASNQVENSKANQQQVDSKLPRQTQRLMELIFNQNHFNAVLEQIGYNANKLPLGKLSQGTLKQGFEHLHELASLIKHPSLAENKYHTSQKEVSRPSSPITVSHLWQPSANVTHRNNWLCSDSQIEILASSLNQLRCCRSSQIPTFRLQPPPFAGLSARTFYQYLLSSSLRSLAADDARA